MFFSGTYSGTAGDLAGGLSFSAGRSFSTIDRDNDSNWNGHCAAREGGGGGWWYGRCTLSNLNGFTRDHITGSESFIPMYIIWWGWKNREQLKPQTKMKFRPSNF